MTKSKDYSLTSKESIEVALESVIRARGLLPHDIEGIDLKKVMNRVHGIPEKVDKPTEFLWAKEMIADGASLAEISRTIGVSRRWLGKRFPLQGWATGGGAEFREQKKAVDEL